MELLVKPVWRSGVALQTMQVTRLAQMAALGFVSGS